jgi:hypothetical protein
MERKMKFILLMVAVALSGCATGPSKQLRNYQAYIEQQMPRAQSGEIKWSAYYKGLYDKAAAAGAPGWKLTSLNQASGAALRYEAGEINKEHFDYEIRAIRAADTSAGDAAIAQARVEADRRAQLGVNQMAAGLAMMQASQPQPVPVINYQQPAPPPGNAYVTGYLRNSTQNGSIRYCNYSNGAVITIASHQLCPQSTK